MRRLLFSTILVVVVSCSGAATQELLDGDFATKNAKPVILIFPTHEQLVASETPTFIWANIQGIGKYRIQIARDAAFQQIAIDKIVNENLYTLSHSDAGGNLPSAIYYWRVQVPAVKNPLMSKVNTIGYLNGFTVHVNHASTATPIQGTQTNPYTTINGAIAAVNALRGGDTTKPAVVRVAAGTYTESITLPGGVSLYGGYDATTWNRDITGNPTYLHANPGSATIMQMQGDVVVALRATTVVDGFYFGQVNAASGAANGVITMNDASPIIQNCDFTGFSSAYAQRLFYISSGSPIIQNNTIHRPAGGPNTSAIAYVTTSSSAQILANQVTLAGDMVAAVTFNASSGMFSGNTFTGTMSNSLCGVCIDNASTTLVSRNTIQFSTTTGDMRPIYIDNGSSPVITNNVVTATLSGGSSSYSGAITMFSGSPVIANNHLIQQVTGGSAAYHVIYHQPPGTNPNATVVNNIIMAAHSGGARVCVSLPAAIPHLRNNVLINCTEAVTGPITGYANSSDNTAYTWAQFSTLDFSGGTTFTVGMDMRLKSSSPSGVRLGGLDARSVTSTTYGSVDVDRDNAARTCPAYPADCLSIGAYELD
jgi:hypothetical protein